MIYDADGEQILSADDVFLYSHDSARLYMALKLGTAENLQFLFPEAIITGNGVSLWKSIIGKLFKSRYEDVLQVSDKLRRWSLDPSKHLQSDLHNLILLLQRVNDVSKSDFPETSMLAIIYEAINRDSREELRMSATYSSRKKQSIDELMQALSESHSALSHTTIKM